MRTRKKVWEWKYDEMRMKEECNIILLDELVVSNNRRGLEWWKEQELFPSPLFIV